MHPPGWGPARPGVTPAVAQPWGKDRPLHASLGVLVRRLAVDQPTRNQKVENGFLAKEKGHLSLTQRTWRAIAHFNNAVINYEAGGNTLRQERS